MVRVGFQTLPLPFLTEKVKVIREVANLQASYSFLKPVQKGSV